MKSKFIIILLLIVASSSGQKSFNDYAQLYPIGDDPNIRLMTSYAKQENILFEANPTVRFSVYNNFMKGLMNNKDHTQAWYISFRPHLRMYTDNSLPVKTPSYRIFLGTQHLFRLTPSGSKEHFWGFSFESGHFSNGQSRCAFSEDIKDGTPECDSVYDLITSSTDLSEILNRNSGNFSTNLTELILNYRMYEIDDDNVPETMYSFNLGYTLYHNRFLGIGNFGGFNDYDIKIYGRQRFILGFEYIKVLKNWDERRISVRQNFELICKPHKSVNPFRSETVVTLYPFPKSRIIGFFISYIYGHDNYNYRFVDSGHQGTIGITWSQFPPFGLTNEL